MIWRTAYSRIAGYFEAETGQRLAAGIKILAKVAVNYHELYGFSLQITDIDPAYTLGDMERRHIAKILKYTGGNKTEAARLLGIGIATLYRKLESYGMKP